jgi:hypothetical protein
MTTTAAAGLASIISFIVFALIAIWYGVPWLKSRSRGEALTALLWVHAFRYIALQIFSAQKFGFAVSDGVRDLIAAGDVIGAILAVSAIAALRYKSPIANGLIWVFVAATAIDLAYGTIMGVGEHLFESAFAVTWLIVTFYVAILWITLALIVWQLLSPKDSARLAV